MPYARKKSIRRKPVRKTTRKSYSLSQKVARIAKSVFMRNTETKHATRQLAGAQELYHNTSVKITKNILYTVQGINDASHRIGDEITVTGVKLYLQMEDKWDRPNTTFCVWVAKCRDAVANLSTVPLKSITGVIPMDPMDTEQVQKVIVRRMYRFNHKDTLIDTGGEGTQSLNKRTTHFRTIWVPCHFKYKYEGGAADVGTYFNYALWVGAYGDTSDSTLDNIGKMKISSEIFYKDA